MHFLSRLVLAVVANLCALFAADRFVQGFSLSGNWKALLVTALIFTALNWILKPVLKLILGPVIVITLGLGALLVNAFLLKLLDFLSPALSIQGLVALLWATLIVSAINIIFHFATRTRA